MFFVGIPRAQILEAVRSAMVTFVGLVVPIALAALVAVFLSTRHFLKPLRAAVTAIDRMAEGDISFELPTARDDEAGRLLSALASMSRRLKSAVAKVQNGARELSTGSRQIAATAQTLSQGATEQAASVEEISATMEDMSASIRQTAAGTVSTQELSAKAAAGAAQGGSAMQETVNAMRRIVTSTGIIAEISRQTNLLALNAASRPHVRARPVEALPSWPVRFAVSRSGPRRPPPR
jgi:methyl-accepting chemotaxis protein